MNKISYTLCCIAVALLSLPAAYAGGDRASTFAIGGNGFNRKSVSREIKLSTAQVEEIKTIVASFKNDTRVLRKKLEALKEDLQLAMLAEKQDTKDIQRILGDIASTKAEINKAAVGKMKDIQSLLTSTQLSRLAELRKTERERIEKARKDAVDGERKPMRTTGVHSFSMSMSGNGDDDESYFNKEEVFPYPDRELWIDNSPFSSAFSFGSSGNWDDDGDNSTFHIAPPGGLWNNRGFNFSMPNMDGLFSDENESDESDDAPSAVPTPPSTTTPPAPRGLDKERINKLNEEMKKKMDDLNDRLKKLEEELKKKENK